jgi:hypothetical protein
MKVDGWWYVEPPGSAFFSTAFDQLRYCWDKCLNYEGDYVEK